MARVLGERDRCSSTPTRARTPSRAGLADAAAQLDCDLLALVDVGGDVLAHGGEPGLASPLCDAVLLAAAGARRPGDSPVIGAIFGPGLRRRAHARGGARARSPSSPRRARMLGAWGLTPARSRTRSRRRSPTCRPRPAPRRCAAPAASDGLGEIRERPAHVPLSPLGAVTVLLRRPRRAALRRARSRGPCATPPTCRGAHPPDRAGRPHGAGLRARRRDYRIERGRSRYSSAARRLREGGEHSLRGGAGAQSWGVRVRCRRRARSADGVSRRGARRTGTDDFARIPRRPAARARTAWLNARELAAFLATGARPGPQRRPARRCTRTWSTPPRV